MTRNLYAVMAGDVPSRGEHHVYLNGRALPPTRIETLARIVRATLTIRYYGKP